MELRGEDYVVTYAESRHTVEFFGTLRLRDSSDYKPLTDILDKALSDSAGLLVLDFRNLQFLNSAGINIISRFVISARKADTAQLRVLGNNEISWQQKSLGNLQKLWDKVSIEIR
ncbi:MAG TPA: hypothetical protein VMU36_00970 [Spirochaetia bacterium]|nr:hypothetical protein [Spirochaetia bacterium]